MHCLPRRAHVARFIVRIVTLLATTTVSQPALADLLWFRDGRLTSQGHELIATLRLAQSFGLRAEDYALPISETDRRALDTGRPDVASQARLDASLTQTVERFVRDLRYGRVSAKQMGFDLPAPASLTSSLEVAHALASAADVAAAIADYEPRARPYRRLKQALAEYRELATHPLTPLSPIKKSIRPGDPFLEAPTLREHLRVLGDLPSNEISETSATLDDTLVLGLKRFQDRHGLEPDGILGKRTFETLATPIDVRVRQIELTMERWRWTSVMQRPNIVVNIPQFMLIALPRDSSETTIEMRVIVGQSTLHTRTPIFTAQMRHVVFQPYWDVPPSIATKELLPLIRKDPSYLDKHHMELVRGQSDNSPIVPATPEAIEELASGKLRIRQRPGADNALGPVKFMFPNPYNVYLHSTPAQELFLLSRRAFSHGCVRVSDPVRLAEYVLKNAPEPWSVGDIEAAMCGPANRRVNLSRPLEVMIFYGTAVATESNGVMFVDDLYGHDRRLADALAKRRR